MEVGYLAIIKTIRYVFAIELKSVVLKKIGNNPKSQFNTEVGIKFKMKK
jgi:hypothetical protein